MDNTQALKNAIEFAKANPNSQEALQLRKRIESGMYKNELVNIKKTPFSNRNIIQKGIGAFLDPIIETGVRVGQAVGDLALTGVNKITGGALDKFTPEGNLSQALNRAENTTTKVPVFGTVIKPAQTITPENIAGNAIKTVALGVSSPALAGAGLIGGEALSQDKSAGDVVINTIVGAIGGKVLEHGFNAVAPFIEKAVLKYGQPMIDKLAQYIPESAKGFMENLSTKISSNVPNLDRNLPQPISNAISKTEQTLSKAVEKPFEVAGKGATFIKSKIIPQTARDSVSKVLKNTGKVTLGEASSGTKLDNAVKAFRTIKENSPNITVKDINGVEKQFDPNKANFIELPQALKKTKDAVYAEYTKLATQAGDSGVKFGAKDFKDINNILDKYSKKGFTPAFSRKASEFKQAIERFNGKATPEEIQGLIEKVNLDVNPASDKAGSTVANEFSQELRKLLDSKLENSGNPAYQITRNKYAQLKSIEKDVINRYKEALRKAGAKPSLIDNITSMDTLYGILTGNPSHIITGLGTKVLKNTYGKIFGAEANLQRTFKLLGNDVIKSESAFFNSPELDKIISNLKNGEGGTLNLDGTTKELGSDFIVSVRSKNLPTKSITKQDIVDFKNANQDIIDKYGEKVKVGVFPLENSNDLSSIDINLSLPKKETSLNLAKLGRQQSVFDEATAVKTNFSEEMFLKTGFSGKNPKQLTIKQIDSVLKGKSEISQTTPLNTPEIIKLRKENASIPSTHTINTPERIKLRKKIVRDSYKTNNKTNLPVKQEKKAIIVTGLPATGKSTVVVSQAEKNGFRTIDSDIYKELLPESKNGKFNSVVHKESDDIANVIFEKAIRNKDNISLPLVGKNQTKMLKILDKLNKVGYDIKLVHIDLPVLKAQQRAITRFEQTGKFVDPLYIKSVGEAPANNYNILKVHPAVKEALRYNADVPFGKNHILTDKTIK